MLRMLRKGEKATQIIHRLLSCLTQWRSLTLGKLEICGYNTRGSQSNIHTEKSRWHTKLYQLLAFDKTRALTAWEPTLPLTGTAKGVPFVNWTNTYECLLVSGNPLDSGCTRENETDQVHTDFTIWALNEPSSSESFLAHRASRNMMYKELDKGTEGRESGWERNRGWALLVEPQITHLRRYLLFHLWFRTYAEQVLKLTCSYISINRKLHLLYHKKTFPFVFH